MCGDKERIARAILFGGVRGENFELQVARRIKFLYTGNRKYVPMTLEAKTPENGEMGASEAGQLLSGYFGNCERF